MVTMPRFWPSRIGLALLTAFAGSVSVEAAGPSVAQPPLSPALQAELDQLTDAEMAVAAVRRYRQAGQLGMARLALQRGFPLARPGTPEHTALTLEAEYELPVSEVRDWLLAGEADRAERQLEELAARHADDDQRSAEIATLQANLPQARRLQQVKRDDEREVVNAVRLRLRAYRDRTGRYPRGYRDLNTVLPADDPILRQYEVIYFRAVGGGYQLVLRNRRVHDNLLTISATGLIE